jgi:hypothetical protein
VDPLTAQPVRGLSWLEQRVLLAGKYNEIRYLTRPQNLPSSQAPEVDPSEDASECSSETLQVIHNQTLVADSLCSSHRSPCPSQGHSGQDAKKQHFMEKQMITYNCLTNPQLSDYSRFLLSEEISYPQALEHTSRGSYLASLGLATGRI